MAKGLYCAAFLLLLTFVLGEACKRDELQKAIMNCNKQDTGMRPMPDDKEKAKKLACCAFLTGEKCLRDAFKSTSCESEESTLNAALSPLTEILNKRGVSCSGIEVSQCGASATTVAMWLLMLAPLVGKYLH